ncbi:cytochrome P450 49A1 [Tribolium castaneum]|uniref:Cytochrome P450 49A1 n=1 Tax=Tribolium castaneum TaxID=7070 RepID=D6WQ58_TRICA|nr:cytochrome P450 49A1 [Tribolium castaneum]
MSLSRKLLVPKRALAVAQRAYSTDRPYSTAIMPELLDELAIPEHVERVEATPRPYSAIPGPKELPLIGNAWRFAPIIGQYKIQELDKVMWSLNRDYGRIVKVGGLIGHPDLLFVFNGDDIEKVFRMEEAMPHRPSMPSLHYYKQILKKDFFDGNAGVIGVHGPKWEEFRKKVQHALLPPQIAKKYIEPLDVIAGDFLHRMEDMLDENQELPNHFLSEIYKWALESVARVSLDTRLGCLEPNLSQNSESQRIINSINTFFWNVAEVELKMPVWRVYKNRSFKKYIGALEDFRTLCLKHIHKSMEKMQEKNFDEIKEENISIVERILLKTDNPKLAAVLALDLLLVGVDTTSIAAASTIYQLSQNPEKQQKLFDELQQVLPENDSKIDVSIQDKMPYLKACIKETLRMYPVIIGNGRSLQTDTVIAGYKVPKGTHVIFPHLVVSNSEDYFHEPHRFLPERWLKTENACPMHKKIHPFVTLPFGYGRRSCLGRRFAEAELQILLAKIFRKYKVEYNYGPLSYKITPTYVPEQPLKFKLVKRE